MADGLFNSISKYLCTFVKSFYCPHTHVRLPSQHTKFNINSASAATDLITIIGNKFLFEILHDCKIKHLLEAIQLGFFYHSI